ncbi:hypothetical protein [Ralstonia pseudosolanacearum]|uniref:hypothetical protein n=1 Tax=Ralstonia pseudosolanacearum TaxID=1310165 RepID=UPI000A744D3E|nr:hypothetical protein [Ralstonia pseudosolanacearum]
MRAIARQIEIFHRDSGRRQKQVTRLPNFKNFYGCDVFSISPIFNSFASATYPDKASKKDSCKIIVH